jgi:hypothetical protein
MMKQRETRAMKREIWLGLVELKYTDPKAPDNVKCAFTNVATWARDSQEFFQKAKEMIEHYGWELLGIEEAGPVDEKLEYSPVIEELIEKTRESPNAVLYGAFHAHPGYDT